MPGAPKPRFFRSPEAFGKWLEANHGKRAELLVGYWKVHTGKPSLTWAQSVEQALRFGWIDGIRRSIGPDAYCIRFTPRKPGSHWSLVNVRTMRALLRQGRVAPAGLAAFEARSAKNTGRAAYSQRRAARFAGEELRRLKADRDAWAWFSQAPPSYQRGCAWWVQSAKRPGTRRRRFGQVLHHSSRGETLPQWRWAKKAKPAAAKAAAGHATSARSKSRAR